MNTRFTSHPNPREFNAQVWEIVRQIPTGKVATYGQIGSYMETPPGLSLKDFSSFAPRWVGGAMANCPEGVPWHRVINSQGKISLKPSKGGEIQKSLLLAEGIEFDSRGKIDLMVFSWKGPDSEANLVDTSLS